MHRDFLKYSTGKLTYEQIWTRGAESQNAVGTLAQWILSGVGGAPDHRDRRADSGTVGRKDVDRPPPAARRPVAKPS